MAYTVFVQPYLEGWEDGEEGATPITADILNDNYDAFLLALNTFIAGEVTPGLCSANPEETATGSLTKINIGGTVYSITGSGGSTVSFTQVLQNGTKIGTITIDGTAVDIFAPTPPTKTSDLTNDSNFVTDASYTHTDNNYTTSEKTKLSGLVEVEANPSGSASTDLTKLAVNGTNYNIPSGGGTTVVANPSAGSTEELEKLQVGSTVYGIPSGGGGDEYIEITGFLTAGSTSITLANGSITSGATYQIFHSEYGVEPTSVSVSNGSMTLTYTARQTDLHVKARIWPYEATWLFNYSNVTIASASDVIETDIDWNEATFLNKSWRLEFSVDPYPTSESCLLNTTREWYMRNGAFNSWKSGSSISINENDIHSNDDVVVTFDPDGTIKCYINGILDDTNTGFDCSYASGNTSQKIKIGIWNNSQYLYTGKINYIRMRIVDDNNIWI